MSLTNTSQVKEYMIEEQGGQPSSSAFSNFSFNMTRETLQVVVKTLWTVGFLVAAVLLGMYKPYLDVL